MSVLARNENQITFIYSSLSPLGKKLLGYLKGTKMKVESIDIAQEQLSDTIWLEVIENLGLPFTEIFPSLEDHFTDLPVDQNYSTDDWLKLINKNPSLLQRPIINGDTAKLISSRSEILKFFSVDSAGLKKKMAHEPPTTSSTTDKERFI